VSVPGHLLLLSRVLRTGLGPLNPTSPSRLARNANLKGGLVFEIITMCPFDVLHRIVVWRKGKAQSRRVQYRGNAIAIPDQPNTGMHYII
jgi:hypothetical protein